MGKKYGNATVGKVNTVNPAWTGIIDSGHLSNLQNRPQEYYKGQLLYLDKDGIITALTEKTPTGLLTYGQNKRTLIDLTVAPMADEVGANQFWKLEKDVDFTAVPPAATAPNSGWGAYITNLATLKDHYKKGSIVYIDEDRELSEVVNDPAFTWLEQTQNMALPMPATPWGNTIFIIDTDAKIAGTSAPYGLNAGWANRISNLAALAAENGGAGVTFTKGATMIIDKDGNLAQLAGGGGVSYMDSIDLSSPSGSNGALERGSLFKVDVPTNFNLVVAGEKNGDSSWTTEFKLSGADLGTGILTLQPDELWLWDDDGNLFNIVTTTKRPIPTTDDYKSYIALGGGYIFDYRSYYLGSADVSAAKPAGVHVGAMFTQSADVQIGGTNSNAGLIRTVHASWTATTVVGTAFGGGQFFYQGDLVAVMDDGAGGFVLRKMAGWPSISALPSV